MLLQRYDVSRQLHSFPAVLLISFRFKDKKFAIFALKDLLGEQFILGFNLNDDWKKGVAGRLFPFLFQQQSEFHTEKSSPTRTLFF